MNMSMWYSMLRWRVLMAVVLFSVAGLRLWAAGDSTVYGSAEARIEAALKSPTSLEFVETPLQDVIELLKDRHKIEIQLDRNELESISIGPDTGVTRNVKGVSLGSALKLLLDDLGLKYVIHNEVLLITSATKAESEEFLVMNLYDVADLVLRNDDAQADYDTLINLIQTTIDTKSWHDSGGDVAPAPFPTGQFLLVTATRETHDGVVDLLAQIRAVAANRSARTPQSSTGAAAIEAALKSPTSLEFVETPLKEVIDFLKERHKIEIQIERRELETLGVSLETQVTKKLKGISLRSALNLILDDLGLNYVVRNEVLLITSPTRAESEEFLAVRVYDVADLVVYKDEKGRPRDDYDMLVNTIQAAVGPRSWNGNGGSGTVTGASFGAAKVLVVAATLETHEKVAEFLAKIREVAAKKNKHSS